MTGSSGFRDLHKAWNKLGAAQRFSWVAALCLIALAAGLLWAGLMQREYRVLFSGLPDKEGGQVVAALEKLRIPYRLDEPGGAIEVPLDQLYIARYRLAAQGLPKDNSMAAEPPAMRFGLSSFQERAAHQRALEAELARSIEAIGGVESARVHLALPKQSSFLRESSAPSASVLLQLAPRATLAAGQVEAVRLLVASGVPGLAATQVNVLDQQGTILGQPSLLNETALPKVQTEMTVEPGPVGSADTGSISSARTSSASLGQPPVSPAKPDSSWLGVRDVKWNLVALIGLLTLLAAWLGLRLRARRLQPGVARESGEEKIQDMDAQLAQLRQQVMADPRLTASVVKQWMQEA